MNGAITAKQYLELRRRPYDADAQEEDDPESEPMQPARIAGPGAVQLPLAERRPQPRPMPRPAPHPMPAAAVLSSTRPRRLTPRERELAYSLWQLYGLSHGGRYIRELGFDAVKAAAEEVRLRMALDDERDRPRNPAGLLVVIAREYAADGIEL